MSLPLRRLGDAVRFNDFCDLGASMHNTVPIRLYGYASLAHSAKPYFVMAMLTRNQWCIRSRKKR